jgi:hypothetical protein
MLTHACNSRKAAQPAPGDVYPPFAEKLAELLPRIDANDRQIEQINDSALPSGAERLRVAELCPRPRELHAEALRECPTAHDRVAPPHLGTLATSGMCGRGGIGFEGHHCRG